MKRSVFFQTVVASIAVFFGYKAKAKPLFTESFSMGVSLGPDGKIKATYKTADEVFDLPFNDHIREFQSLSSNGRLVTHGVFDEHEKNVNLIRFGGDTRTKEYRWDDIKHRWVFVRFLN